MGGRRSRHWLLGIGVLVLALVVVRLALPGLVRNYVNDYLAGLNGYRGHVERIHLAIWRGAYRIDGLIIVRHNGDIEQPFFSSRQIDLSVEWKQLWRGSLVAEAEFTDPLLNLVKGRTDATSQLGGEQNWRTTLEGLFPIRLNTVRVNNGRVTFVAPGIRTQDALHAEQVAATITNLTNVADSNHEAFSGFRMTGRVLGEALAEINGRVDPLAPQPTFDVDLKLQKVSLPKVNPWLNQYIKADAARGDFQLYMELAAANGRFKGYAKPIMQNVDLTGTEDRDDNALRRIWEHLVEFAARIFENRQEQQVAARIPFSGTVENPKAGILATMISVVRNAFVSAFARSLEGSISLRDVRQNLKDIDVQEDKSRADR